MIFDRSVRHYDQDKRLHVDKTVISIANVCEYYGAEIPNAKDLGLEPTKKYKLYRDPAELEAAAPTYHNVPLLVRHAAVNADDPKRDALSGTVSNISFENPYLYGSLAVWTQEGIDLIESGEQEQLSAGYYFTADMTPGVTPEGEHFDGRMRNLICNHVAQVKEGRVGPESTVADQSISETPPMPSKYPALAKFLAKDADIVAFDAAMDAEAEKEKEKAEDAERDYYGKTQDEWEEMSAKDKKKARDEWKKAEDKRAKDAEEETAKNIAAKEKQGGSGNDSAITVGDLKRLIAEDRKAHRGEILAAVTELAEARELVKPLVGVIALDSAEADYAFALKQAN
ncbi:DUF2213 domain-containing protein, partial [Rhodoblastus sp.]|uniref:DUF2213 domain-containing protein n=1 Tax=Rhodoblastus sp. TaxID=1962975 RepID=UPI003F947395